MKVTLLRTALAALCFAGLAVTTASAALMTFQPASVNTGIDGNFSPAIARDGVFDTLVGGQPAAELLPNNLTDARFAVEYNISAIPANATITLATLTFTEFVDGSPHGDGTGTIIQLHGYAGDGIVDLHDMVANNLLLSDISDGVKGTAVLPVTSFVTSLVNQGEPFAGFMCKSVTELLSAYYQIQDSPNLTISYTVVPEPGTALVGVLLLGVATARRRRDQRTRTE